MIRSWGRCRNLPDVCPSALTTLPTGAGLQAAQPGLPAAPLLRRHRRQGPGAAGRLAAAVSGLQSRAWVAWAEACCPATRGCSLPSLPDPPPPPPTPTPRPLPPQLVEYARRDVRHLLHLADVLGQELLHEPAPHGHGAQHAQPAQGKEHAEQYDVPADAEEQPPAPPRRGGELVRLEAEPAVVPPSVVEQSAECRQALEAAMAAPHSRLERAVHRSQALTLTVFQPTPPSVAVATAATGLMRRHIAAQQQQHARLTPEQVQALEGVADCVHVLASWRDAAARQADEGLQCLLPDAALLRLAEAVAASVPPEASNLRGREQGLSAAQLAQLVEGDGAAAVEPAEAGAPGQGGAGSCGCYPAILLQQAANVAAALSEAAAGQRPWVSPDLQQLLAEAAGSGGAHGRHGGGSNKASKRRDPAAFKRRLAERFAAKGVVYENARMYSLEGELLCHTGAWASRCCGLRVSSCSVLHLRARPAHCYAHLAHMPADRRKLEWYIKKGLAEKVCSPGVIEAHAEVLLLWCVLATLTCNLAPPCPAQLSDDPLTVRLSFQHQMGDQQQGVSGEERCAT